MFSLIISPILEQTPKFFLYDSDECSSLHSVVLSCFLQWIGFYGLLGNKLWVVATDCEFDVLLRGHVHVQKNTRSFLSHASMKGTQADVMHYLIIGSLACRVVWLCEIMS